ncbi:MAG TPA: hypothetical protein EYG57_14345 [Planctomycetes bacterium]|nr:hypothetical protein [Planctomycetota bacterium]
MKDRTDRDRRAQHSDNADVNEKMKKERETQAARIWPILERIDGIDEIRKHDWRPPCLGN